MPIFKYDFSMPASTEKEAESKMRSLTALAAKLGAKELEKLAYIIQHDPVKTAMAKKALGV